jgi:hypothetical protein
VQNINTARKDFDLLVVPNEGHGVFRSSGDVSYGLRRQYDFLCAIYDKSRRRIGTRYRDSRLVRRSRNCRLRRPQGTLIMCGRCLRYFPAA